MVTTAESGAIAGYSGVEMIDGRRLSLGVGTALLVEGWESQAADDWGSAEANGWGSEAALWTLGTGSTEARP